MNLTEYEKKVKAGKLPNLLWFTGEERGLMRTYLKELDAKLVEDIDKLPALMLSGSLLKKQQTFYVQDNKKILSWDPNDLKKLTSTNRLIIVTSTIDKRSKVAKVFSRDTVEFTKRSTEELASLVLKELPQLDQGCANILVHCCENDLSRLHLEVHKLKHLSEETVITFELLTELVTPPLEDAIFEMVDCIAFKRKLDSYEIYRDLIELGESPIKIVSLLYTKFKQIFLVQSLAGEDNQTVAGKTGLTFWQVKKAREVMGRFSDWRLIEILKDVQGAEINMKTGAVEIELAMEDLLIRILEE